MNKKKDDFRSECSQEMSQDEDSFANWLDPCYNCESCTGEDDELMSIFNMAEVWFSDSTDEGTERDAKAP